MKKEIMTKICCECHQVHTLPDYRSTCQYCNKIAAAHDLSKTKGLVTICTACKNKSSWVTYDTKDKVRAIFSKIPRDTSSTKTTLVVPKGTLTQNK